MHEHDHDHEHEEPKTGVHFEHLDPEELQKLLEASYGPVAWCNRCSRKHRRRACQLIYATVEVTPRTAKNSKRVVKNTTTTRLVHQKVEE